MFACPRSAGVMARPFIMRSLRTRWSLSAFSPVALWLAHVRFVLRDVDGPVT